MLRIRQFWIERDKVEFKFYRIPPIFRYTGEHEFGVVIWRHTYIVSWGKDPLRRIGAPRVSCKTCEGAGEVSNKTIGWEVECDACDGRGWTNEEA